MVTNNASDLKDLMAKDEEFLSRALYRVYHVVAEKGEGSYLYTTDGEKFLDLTCGIGVTQLGHCHPEITKAAQEQLSRLVHISCVTHHTENIKLAEKLSEITPGKVNSSFFCNSGAEAVDGALKLSRKVNTGRPNIISFRGGFHGRTLGSISVSSSKVSMRKDFFPLLPGVFFVEYPKKDPQKTFDELEKLFKLELSPDSVSAMIIEPMLGEGGYIPAPKGFLKELRKICNEHGILLICDEVQSGIGRTGKWFACEHYEVEPDIITIAKGIANGLPMGAFSSRKELMDSMAPGTHGSTFGGNPVICAAALKTLEVIERENILEYVSSTGNEVIKHLRSELPANIDVRGMGFMIGIELENKEKADNILKECFNQKMLLLPCSPDQNAIRVIPPLNIEKSLLLNTVDKIISIIKKLG